MPTKQSSESAQSQSDKFKDLAREVEADPDEKAWDERLKKVAKAKPAPEKPSGDDGG